VSDEEKWATRKEVLILNTLCFVLGMFVSFILIGVHP